MQIFAIALKNAAFEKNIKYHIGFLPAASFQRAFLSLKKLLIYGKVRKWSSIGGKKRKSK
jgi:hypothetical protein